jgi:NADH:ubiquinone oxidoreductase subunit
MFGWLKPIATWWNGATLLTRAEAWLSHERVGEDAAGNRYFQSRDGKRRWVLYAGEADASRIPPEWHLWIHGATMPPPSHRPVARPVWARPHQPNATGSPAAWTPAGSLAKGGPRARATGDYEAWTPD